MVNIKDRVVALLEAGLTKQQLRAIHAKNLGIRRSVDSSIFNPKGVRTKAGTSVDNAGPYSASMLSHPGSKFRSQIAQRLRIMKRYGKVNGIINFRGGKEYKIGSNQLYKKHKRKF